MKFIIEHLSKRFEQKEVLKDIDFTFEEGRIYGLLGRNGAGKTTLFNCLNRDIKADSGSFCLEENGVRREVAAEDIGYVLSTPTVPEFLTGREFLKFFMDINSDSIRDPKPLDEYFAEMSIAPEDRDKLLKDYSHGMKNKMQMLVNIIAQPNILLLDAADQPGRGGGRGDEEPAPVPEGRADHHFLHPHPGPGPGSVRRDRAAQPRGAGGGGEVQPGRPRLQGEDHHGAERGELCLKHCASHSP